MAVKLVKSIKNFSLRNYLIDIVLFIYIYAYIKRKSNEKPCPSPKAQPFGSLLHKP